MRVLRNALFSCTAMILVGCSTHPLPKQVTRDTTAQIVRKIFCEGREALDEITVEILRYSRFQELQNLAHSIESGSGFARELFLNPKYRKLLSQDKNIVGIFTAFTLSAVGFDFTFDITENNNNMIDINLRSIFSRDILTVGIKKGKNLTRQNERRFQIGSTFFALHLEPFDPIQCKSIVARHRHLIYPITGKIGLKEVFETYLKLSGGPGEGLGADIFGQKKTERFTDTLTFTTALSSTLNPKIEVNPASTNRTGLLNATGTFSNSRTDKHAVAIAVETGKPARAKTLLAAYNKGRVRALQLSLSSLDQLRGENTFETIRENERRLDALEQQ